MLGLTPMVATSLDNFVYPVNFSAALCTAHPVPCTELNPKVLHRQSYAGPKRSLPLRSLEEIGVRSHLKEALTAGYQKMV